MNESVGNISIYLFYIKGNVLYLVYRAVRAIAIELKYSWFEMVKIILKITKENENFIAFDKSIYDCHAHTVTLLWYKYAKWRT